jgi:hypothetical protein
MKKRVRTPLVSMQIYTMIGGNARSPNRVPIPLTMTRCRPTTGRITMKTKRRPKRGKPDPAILADVVARVVRVGADNAANVRSTAADAQAGTQVDPATPSAWIDAPRWQRG